MRTLIINMHPKPAESKRGKAVLDRLRGLPGVTVHNLAGEFKPGHPESIAHEQELVVQHDRILFLYPVQWYGMPALGKAYLDEVFCYGFAFVAGESRFAKLKGKTFRVMATTGAPSASYKDSPLLTEMPKSLARYCGMNYEEPFFYYADDAETKLAGLSLK